MPLIHDVLFGWTGQESVKHFHSDLFCRTHDMVDKQVQGFWLNAVYFKNTFKGSFFFCLLSHYFSFPQATNQTLLDKFKRQHEGNSYIEFPAVMEPAFIIRHYAGKVKYGVKVSWMLISKSNHWSDVIFVLLDLTHFLLLNNIVIGVLVKTFSQFGLTCVFQFIQWGFKEDLCKMLGRTVLKVKALATFSVCFPLSMYLGDTVEEVVQEIPPVQDRAWRHPDIATMSLVWLRLQIFVEFHACDRTVCCYVKVKTLKNKQNQIGIPDPQAVKCDHHYRRPVAQHKLLNTGLNIKIQYRWLWVIWMEMSSVKPTELSSNPTAPHSLAAHFVFWFYYRSSARHGRQIEKDETRDKQR